MFDFLKEVVDLFGSSGIQYMLSGSLAFNLYAIPRSTRDIDVIADISLHDLDKFISLFHDRYYYSKPAIEDAIRRKGMFNVIDPASGYKLDVIVLGDQPYERQKFNRRRIIDMENRKIHVITSEDLVISKLIWIQQLDSELQKRDISQLMLKEDIDVAYIHSWCNKLNLNTYGLF
ncbi:MAG: hypothetical protein JW973_02245 [Bacteroidales bacterium]|nr:hypothetical protein [Bacteroidales bacterium]